ncbi:MAG: hypothetical protein EXR86_08930 [Gammaproteobacteria bacterium]|nr:hypothetical protein [Gammaproteobacteria bacterium]
MHPVNPFTAPLRFVPRFSSAVAKALGGAHALLAILVLSASPFSWVNVVCIAGILLSALTTWWELRAVPKDFSALLYDADGSWWATREEGVRAAGAVAGPALSSPWIVVVPLRIETRRYTVVLAADVIPRDLLRRLRIGLRHRSSKPTTTSLAA